MKKVLLISLLFSLVACQNDTSSSENNTLNNTEKSTTSNVAITGTSSGSEIRQNFSKACVESALGGNEQASFEEQERAIDTCDCVYDEGIKAYGNVNNWEAAIQDFDKKQTDEKLKKVSDDAVQLCLSKHMSDNSATVSASDVK